MTLPYRARAVVLEPVEMIVVDVTQAVYEIVVAVAVQIAYNGRAEPCVARDDGMLRQLAKAGVS